MVTKTSFSFIWPDYELSNFRDKILKKHQQQQRQLDSHADPQNSFVGTK